MAKPPNPPGAGANGQGGHGDIDALYRAHAGDLVAWQCMISLFPYFIEGWGRQRAN